MINLNTVGGLWLIAFLIWFAWDGVQEFWKSTRKDMDAGMAFVITAFYLLCGAVLTFVFALFASHLHWK